MSRSASAGATTAVAPALARPATTRLIMAGVLPVDTLSQAGSAAGRTVPSGSLVGLLTGPAPREGHA